MLLPRRKRAVHAKVWAFVFVLAVPAMVGADVPTLSQFDPNWPLDGRTAFLFSTPQDENVVVDTLRWSGRFYKGEPGSIEQFSFRIYEDVVGEPGGTLADIEVLDYASQELDEGTFLYGSIIHRIVIPAGMSVWIEIQARSPAVPQWGITRIDTPTASDERRLRAPEMGIDRWTWFPWFENPEAEGSPCEAFRDDPPDTTVEDPIEDFLVPRVDPNPTTGFVRVRLLLDTTRHLEAAVFDVRGRRVRTLANEMRSDGPILLIWNGRGDDGSGLSSGMYFLRVRLDSREFIQKKILLFRGGN